MLSLIEQPENYSQVLRRVFVATLISGIASTLVLSYFSPVVQALLFSDPTRMTVGPIDLPWLAVLIPLLLALFSRVVKLHDRISDVLGLRSRFDVRHILVPLARGVGINATSELETRLRSERDDLMGQVFYKYAPNANDAVINRQYVATALDHWAWLWCFVEPIPVVLLSGVIAWAIVGFWAGTLFFLAAVILAVIARMIWPACVRGAKPQVTDILRDQTRKDEIHAVLSQRV